MLDDTGREHGNRCSRNSARTGLVSVPEREELGLSFLRDLVGRWRRRRIGVLAPGPRQGNGWVESF